MMCLVGGEMFLPPYMSPQSLWPQSFLQKHCLSVQFCGCILGLSLVTLGFVFLYCTLLVHTSKRTQRSMERGPEERMPELSYPVRQHCSLSGGTSCLQNSHNKFLLQEIEVVLWAVKIHNPFGKFYFGPIPTNSFYMHCSVFFSVTVSCQV